MEEAQLNQLLNTIEFTLDTWGNDEFKTVSLTILQFGQFLSNLAPLLEEAGKITFKKTVYPRGMILIGSNIDNLQNSPVGEGDNLREVGTPGCILYNGKGPKDPSLSLSMNNMPYYNYSSNNSQTWTGSLTTGMTAGYLRYVIPKYCSPPKKDGDTNYPEVQTYTHRMRKTNVDYVYVFDRNYSTLSPVSYVLLGCWGETPNLYGPTNFRYRRPAFTVGSSTPIINLFAGPRLYFFVVRGERKIIK